MASMTACPQCYQESTVMSNSFGRKCVRCGWTRKNPNAPKPRRRRRATAPRVTYRAPKPWVPVAVAARIEVADETSLTLSAPPVVERDRVEKLKTRIVETLTAQGRMTRDRLGELLLPELSPDECRRYIMPRTSELIAEKRVRQTAFKRLTRGGNEAFMVEVVRDA